MTVTIKMPDEPAFTATVDDNVDRSAIPDAVADAVRVKHPRATVSATFTASPGARTGTVRVNNGFGYWSINR